MVAAMQRLSSEDRKKGIVEAAIPLFANKGFDGVTTREIAEAAGVSEALLYKHFPGKESLFLEIQDHCCNNQNDVAEMLAAMESSTQGLITASYFMFRQICFGSPTSSVPPEVHGRMMLASLRTDGDFARLLIERRMVPFVPKLMECVEVGERAKEIRPGAVSRENLIWFAHHVAIGVKIMSLPEKNVIPYKGGAEEIFDQAFQFTLRGMGITDTAIDKYYDAEQFKKIIDEGFKKSQQQQEIQS